MGRNFFLFGIETIVFIIMNIYYFTSASMYRCMILPLLFFNPNLFWLIDGYIQRIGYALLAGCGWTAGFRYYEVGEDISRCLDEECLVIANHQTPLDIISLMSVFYSKKRVADRLMWIMDNNFKYTHFGIVGGLRGDFHIKQLQGEITRNAELNRLKYHVIDVYPSCRRQWIALFPEGGLLHKRRESNKRYALKHGFPVLEHVCLPRTGAMHTIVNVLHPRTIANAILQHERESGGSCKCERHRDLKPLKWVIDITFGYPKGNIPCLSSWWTLVPKGDRSLVYLYYRKYPIEEVPTESEQLQKWMYDRFIEKESLLTEFYKTGLFPPASTNRHNAIDFSRWWNLVNHFFWICSFYLFCKMISVMFCFLLKCPTLTLL